MAVRIIVVPAPSANVNISNTVVVVRPTISKHSERVYIYMYAHVIRDASPISKYQIVFQMVMRIEKLVE